MCVCVYIKPEVKKMIPRHETTAINEAFVLGGYMKIAIW